ncbi:GTPase [Saccharibacillus sacchari]|uniref:GTPase n=1 Tax=Saccharibacillus sacchari TaxID=456493 RepID=UPI0004B7E60A|nr:GTPase [Saccharibacillus sacchari]
MENAHNDRFKEALQASRKTAKEAYKESLFFADEVKYQVEELTRNIRVQTDALLREKDAENFSFFPVLSGIARKLEMQTSESMQDLRHSIELKKKHLNDFTVALFGRTKAGKSTIREALTCGDGGTIGMGAQRTTRDVREYHWNGLRLLDVPGFEAFKGDDDTAKAHDIIDQSDFILFLASDDSIQPGEFDHMVRLQEINKPFMILLNVKYNINNEAELKRFVRIPHKIFDNERLDEHQKHIRSYVKQHMNIPYVKIVNIHADAGFKSTQPAYEAYNADLWRLSNLDEVHNAISAEVQKRGKQRRLLTFYDSVIYFADTLEKMMFEEQLSIRTQAKFMVKKRKELSAFFDRFSSDGEGRINTACKKHFDRIKQWIPDFVDTNLGSSNIDNLLTSRLKEEQDVLKSKMEGELQSIVSELQEKLAEFTKQYQFDLELLETDPVEMNGLKKGQVGRIAKWGGVVVGGVSATAFILAQVGIANFWNPVGWIAMGVSAGAGLFSWLFGDWEEKKWNKAKHDAKEQLTRMIDDAHKKAVESYLGWFDRQIIRKGKKEMLGQVSVYINGLFGIANELKVFSSEIRLRKMNMNKKLFAKLLSFEGVNCTESQMIALSREQGRGTKIMVPNEWQMVGGIKTNIDIICGEQVHLFSDTPNITERICRALYPADVTPDMIQLSEVVESRQQEATITVPTREKGKLIGKKGINVRLASEITGVKLIIP